MTESDTSRQKLWENQRVKTPTVLQMEAVECGAASLAMVLAYYGRYVPLEELRLETGVSRDGSKASNIIAAARKYGLEAKGYSTILEDLGEYRLPMIVFWNYYHFLVLEGIKKDKFYLNDPDKGPCVVSRQTFENSFTGVVLTFEPGPNFKPGGEKRDIIKSLRSRLQGYGVALLYVILAGLLLVIPGLVIPMFIRIFVDNILVHQMYGWFKPLILAMGVTALISAGLTWLQKYFLVRFNTKLSLSTSSKFMRHIFRLPVEFFSQRMPGEITSRAMLNDKVAALLSGDIATNAISLVMIVFYAILMFRYDVVLTLVGIAFAAVNVIVLKSVARRRIVTNQSLQQEKGKLMGISMGGIQIMETLKAGSTESDFFSMWSGQQAKVMTSEQKMAVPTQMLNILPTFLTQLSTMAILCLGGFRVMDGHLSMGMLVAYQSLMLSFMMPVTMLVGLGLKIQEITSDMDRLDDVLRYKQDKRYTFAPGAGDTGFSKLKGNVELRSISFGYSRLEDPLIEDFSMKLSPGSRVALVGGSGSGKSTVAKLVAGLYEPWKGEILFDGKRRDEINPDTVCASVAMVDQDIFMFEGSIHDNIAMWDSTLPEDTVKLAAKDACIHDDISARPGGYSSMIQEDGGNFSGGQRQRMEIARALSVNPTLLIMDEATSALDPATEKLIDDNLRRRGCTCIIIAHRLSTIRDCDEIIVLHKGKVVQRGTHDELMKQGGAYADLIKTQ